MTDSLLIPLTPEQSTFTFDGGLAGRMTDPVETALRDISGQHSPAENTEIPFLAARAVVLDDERTTAAFGRRTEVWLDYGTTSGSLTPAEAREVLEAMRDFLPRLEAVIEIAEREAADDFPGDPELARLHLEAEDLRIKAITEGAQA
ncbi:hypothetical protein [Streptomyces bauhiniae]